MTSAIVHAFNGTDIRQLPDDGYVHVNPMCQASGKKFYSYSRLKTTKDYLEALSRSAGIHADLLIRQVTTGKNEERGTWVHPKVAIHLAQWCSPEFAVFVTNLVFDWMSGNVAPPPPPIPDEDDEACDASGLLFLLHLQHQELSKQQIMVLFVLHFARAWVPYTRIAPPARLSSGATLKALRRLAKAGLVETRIKGTIARIVPEQLIATQGQANLRGFGGAPALEGLKEH